MPFTRFLMSSNILILSVKEFTTSCIACDDITGSSMSSFLLLLGLSDIETLKEQLSVFFHDGFTLTVSHNIIDTCCPSCRDR